MKKFKDEKTSITPDTIPNKNIELDKIKTTNVNILLNRVRQDKKRSFKKRLIFSFLLIVLVTLVFIYFLI